LTVTGTGSEAVFTFPASGVTLYNDSITSTATEVASLNTSEFSASRRVTSNKDYICDDLGPWTRTYTINAVPLATSYTWSVPPGATITSGQNSTSIDVDWTGVTPGNYEVCVVANSSCGTSPSSCFPIVVYHCCIPPVVNNMATSLCSGGAIGVVLPTLGTSGTAITRYDITAVQDPGLSGTPTTGTNITDPNAIASDAFSNSTNTPLQVVYTVTPYSYSCAGGIFTVTVTVNPFPTVAVNPGDQTVCPGAAFTIDITNPNNVAGTTFSWTRTDNPALTGMLLSGTGTPITGTFSSSSPQTSQSTTFTVTATATGCSTSTGATVTVIDNTGPVVVNCPSSVNQGTNAGLCVATVTWSEPTANDNCDGALAYFSRSHAPGSTFPIGITTVTYIFQDAAGNGATCTFNVTVSDTEGPAITCPADINTYEQPAGSGSASVTVPVPATGDNCGVASVINSFTGTDNASGSYPLGTTTVIYTVTDTYGNVTTCSFDVTVEVCPIPGVITGPTAVCRTASETYSIVPVPGAISYNWTVPTGSVITSGQGTTSITVTIGPNPGNICVTASNGICESAPSCTAITVNDVPPRPVFIE
jgi:hypothetical protein